MYNEYSDLNKLLDVIDSFMIDFLIAFWASRSTNAQAFKYSKLFSMKKRSTQGTLFDKNK